MSAEKKELIISPLEDEELEQKQQEVRSDNLAQDEGKSPQKYKMAEKTKNPDKVRAGKISQVKRKERKEAKDRRIKELEAELARKEELLSHRKLEQKDLDYITSSLFEKMSQMKLEKPKPNVKPEPEPKPEPVQLNITPQGAPVVKKESALERRKRLKLEMGLL